MPLVAHNNLPSFQLLEERGQIVLSAERAEHQDIRELHIGFLNMMPDAALAITAAPGVDQVINTGIRVHKDKPMVVRPIPRPSAKTQDVIWSGVAPSDLAA